MINKAVPDEQAIQEVSYLRNKVTEFAINKINYSDSKVTKSSHSNNFNKLECYRCSGKGHLPSSCLFKRAKYFKCSKIEHIKGL